MKQILAIILFFIGTLVYAQNISVTDFHLEEMDLTANQQGTTVLDQNGEKCALIKIKTTQTGFSFDAGSLGVSKTLQKTAEIWVYVPHGVRKLSVSHQKFGSLDYALPVTTQKAKTYIMELKAETPLPVNSQKLVIKCMQRNAVVSIDGDMIDLSNGIGEVTLKLGSHKYVAMANGYYQTEGTIELKAERPGKLTIELEPKEKVELAQSDNSTNTDTSSDNGTESIITNDNSPAGLLRQFVNEVLSWYEINDIQVDVNELSRKVGGKKETDAGKLDYIGLKDKTRIYYNNTGEITRIQISPKSLSKTKQFPSVLSRLNWDSGVADWAQWLKDNNLQNSSIQQNKMVCMSSVVRINENLFVIVSRMGVLSYNYITFYMSRTPMGFVTM